MQRFLEQKKVVFGLGFLIIGIILIWWLSGGEKNNLASEIAQNDTHTPTLPQVTVLTERHFLEQIIPLQEASVLVARLVIEKGATTEPIRDTALNVITGQEQELAIVRGWYETWYETSLTATSSLYSFPAFSSEGTTLDQAWLRAMIDFRRHVESLAVEVLKLELQPETYEYAKSLITTQQEEIQIMEEILRSFEA